MVWCVWGLEVDAGGQIGSDNRVRCATRSVSDNSERLTRVYVTDLSNVMHRIFTFG